MRTRSKSQVSKVACLVAASVLACGVATARPSGSSMPKQVEPDARGGSQATRESLVAVFGGQGFRVLKWVCAHCVEPAPQPGNPSPEIDTQAPPPTVTGASTGAPRRR